MPICWRALLEWPLTRSSSAGSSFFSGSYWDMSRRIALHSAKQRWWRRNRYVTYSNLVHPAKETKPCKPGQTENHLPGLDAAGEHGGQTKGWSKRKNLRATHGEFKQASEVKRRESVVAVSKSGSQPSCLLPQRSMRSDSWPSKEILLEPSKSLFTAAANSQAES